MFDHIVLRRSEGGQPISVGQIAESLLYYQHVHIFIDRGTLFNLIRQIGIGGILTLLDRVELSAVYCEEMLGTHTDSAGVSKFHNYVAMTVIGHENVGKFKTVSGRLQFEIERKGIPKADAKRFSLAFLKRVPVRKFSGDYFLQGGITHAAKRDLLDPEFARQAICQAIASTPGGYVVGNNLRLEIINSELGMFVFTNIDFELINRRRVETIPPLEPLTIANLLTNILEARADLALASFYGGDFVTSAAVSSIIKVRHSDLLRRSGINLESRQQFTDVVLPDSPSLAEVIDSGERSLDDFLVLLDRSARFKDWLRAVNPDENLIRTYMRDVSSEGWIQKLPAKSLRYVFASALNTTHPLVGAAAGFVDHFLMEKLFSGWRPNHFVSGRLQPFVEGL